MKILLIDPPYSLNEIGGSRQNFKQVLNKVASLGLGYLAATAEKAGHEVRICDCVFDREFNGLSEIARKFNPGVIGITATTPTFTNAAKIVSNLRKIMPDAIFVAGGAHPTACPENCLDTGLFNFLVLGEGEETFLELLSVIHSGEKIPYENIKGIAFKHNGRVVITSKRSRISDLDSLPFPSRHLFPPLKLYQPTPASYRRLPLATVMTSRGCPSKCTFCDRAVFGENFRKRSAANIMAEIEDLVNKYGAREIRFFDDTFTFDSLHTEEVCMAIRRSKLRIPWTCLTRVASVNPQMLKMMRASGCWQVLFGLESGDDAILKHLGKGNTVEQNKRAVFWAKKAGLSIRADFLVGSPWETKESLRKTIDFAKSLPLDFAHFNKFVPLPGTDIYRGLTAAGEKIVFGCGSYINNHSDFIYIPRGFSSQEYGEFLDNSYKQFYLRPGYICRRILSIRSLSESLGQVKGAISILSLKH